MSPSCGRWNKYPYDMSSPKGGTLYGLAPGRMRRDLTTRTQADYAAVANEETRSQVAGRLALICLGYGLANCWTVSRCSAGQQTFLTLV